ncbi:hypothetical protein STEG23_027833, partial [Scotinomys teguina]
IRQNRSCVLHMKHCTLNSEQNPPENNKDVEKGKGLNMIMFAIGFLGKALYAFWKNNYKNQLINPLTAISR